MASVAAASPADSCCVGGVAARGGDVATSSTSSSARPQFAFGRACARPGLFQRFFEFPSLLDSELLFLGSALLELGSAALYLFEFGLQPRHLIPLFLQIGLMSDSTRNLAVLIFGCAEIAGSAC